MREIEKIQKLISLVQSDSEKREIIQAEETLSNAFHTMLGQTQEYLTIGAKPVSGPIGIKEALSRLKHSGDIYGIEFPSLDNKRDLLMYTITYAKQIIFDDEL